MDACFLQVVKKAGLKIVGVAFRISPRWAEYIYKYVGAVMVGEENCE